MGSTSNTSGAGTVSTLTGGMILFGVGIIIIATGKLLQYVVYGLGQRSPATAGVDRGAENIGTGEPRLVQVQMNEILASASSGGTDETTTDLVAAASAPAANSEVQNRGVEVEVVIEAPRHSSSHQTDVRHILGNVFTTTYRMVAELKSHNLHISTGCVMGLLFAAGVLVITICASCYHLITVLFFHVFFSRNNLCLCAYN